MPLDNPNLSLSWISPSDIFILSILAIHFMLISFCCGLKG